MRQTHFADTLISSPPHSLTRPDPTLRLWITGGGDPWKRGSSLSVFDTQRGTTCSLVTGVRPQKTQVRLATGFLGSYSLTVEDLSNHETFQDAERAPHALKGAEHGQVEMHVKRLLLSPPDACDLEVYRSGAAELHIHFGWPPRIADRNLPANYCAFSRKRVSTEADVVHSLTRRKMNDGPSDSTTNFSQGAVLVSIINPIDDAERPDMGLVSYVIGLRHYHECPSKRVNAPDGSLKVFPGLRILDHELAVFVPSEDVLIDNREARNLCAFLLGYARDDDMIQRASEVVYKVSKHQGDNRIRVFSDMDAKADVSLAVGLSDANELVRVAFCVPPDFCPDVYHVLLSTLDLEPPGVSHGVELHYGQQEDSNNPKGTRDTHAQARQRAPRPQEGCKGKALNPRQREEVASRTERGHSGSDYSARNTC